MNKQPYPTDPSTSEQTMVSNFSLLTLSFIVVLLLMARPAFSMVQVSGTKPDCKALIKAVEEKNYSRIQELLSSVDPNCTVQDPERKFSKGKNKGQIFLQSARSPLVASARIGDVKSGMILTNAGADIRLHASKDETPLIAASASGNIDYVKFLVSKGAGVNEAFTGEGTALIAASRAGHTDIVKFLIKQGAEVDQFVTTDGTALVNGIRSGQYEVSNILLQHGADPLLRTPTDEDPAYHARRQKGKRFLELLNQYQKKRITQDLQGKSASAEKDDLTVWLRNTIDSTMQANNIPALSIGIIRDGKAYYSDGFGSFQRGGEKKVDEHSLYQIGSNSKQFTGVIIKSLLNEGELKLTDPIISYISGLTPKAKKELREITVEHLLLHKSGLPSRAPGSKRLEGDAMTVPYTEEDLLSDLNNLHLDFKPGTDFNYSNLGYGVLGYIAESATGTDYSDLLKKYITQKLDMNSTFVNPTPEDRLQIVTPYRKDERLKETKPWRMGLLTAAGGVYSNVEDLTKYMRTQIKVYSNNNEEKADNPFVLNQDQKKYGNYYGFGLWLTVDEKGRSYEHGGDLDGYASTYVFSPQRQTGLIILTSSGGGWLGELESLIGGKLGF